MNDSILNYIYTDDIPLGFVDGIPYYSTQFYAPTNFLYKNGIFVLFKNGSPSYGYFVINDPSTCIIIPYSDNFLCFGKIVDDNTSVFDNSGLKNHVGKWLLGSGGITWDYNLSFLTFEDAYVYLAQQMIENPSSLSPWSYCFTYVQSVSLVPVQYGGEWRYPVTLSQRFCNGFACFPRCCYPDFIPIVKTLGGIPVTDQPQNLKLICQLLGVNTAENGLIDCALMKSYLKRLVEILGGVSSTEPNENLKSICYLLGVNTAENGLTDCALSKDYVKRNGVMLGAENA